MNWTAQSAVSRAEARSAGRSECTSFSACGCNNANVAGWEHQDGNTVVASQVWCRTPKSVVCCVPDAPVRRQARCRSTAKHQGPCQQWVHATLMGAQKNAQQQQQLFRRLQFIPDAPLMPSLAPGTAHALSSPQQHQHTPSSRPSMARTRSADAGFCSEGAVQLRWSTPRKAVRRMAPGGTWSSAAAQRRTTTAAATARAAAAAAASHAAPAPAAVLHNHHQQGQYQQQQQPALVASHALADCSRLPPCR